MAQPCVVCHHRDAETGVVCDDDRKRFADQLTDLPRKYAALGLKLMPEGGTSDGLGVHTSQVEAPLGIDVNALSLLAAGNEQVSAALHPLYRRYSITTTVKVETVAKGVTVVQERPVTQWFNEAVHGPDGKPVMVPDDDQIGTLPPKEWLDSTVRSWRAQLGHHVPARTPRHIVFRGQDRHVSIWPANPVRDHRAEASIRLTPRTVWAVLGTRAGLNAYLLLHAYEHQRRERVRRYLGLLGNVPAADRPVDPLLDDIETRFGQAPPSQAMAWDIDYLLTWLDTACERDLGIADFAAELAALTAELERAIGEQPTLTWIGRCPAMLIEEQPAADGEVPTVRRKPCGAGLWHETGWAQVPCPRCHTPWEVRGPSSVRTAREIRRVWPVDRRRRYSADDIDGLAFPTCPSCDQMVRPAWREVTAPGDRVRYWQPTGATCVNGCADAGRTL